MNNDNGMWVNTAVKALLLAAAAALLLGAGALRAEQHEGAGHDESAKADDMKSGMRSVVNSLDAEVVAIDVENRQISVLGPLGNETTLTVPEEVADMSQIALGDTIRVTFLAAMAGEVREPTEEELAEPLVILTDAAISEDPAMPGVGEATMVRAVCTVEGMNRLTGTVVIKGPRGRVHVIGDVDPAKMEGVTLGQTVVIEYAEATAITLEKPGT